MLVQQDKIEIKLQNIICWNMDNNYKNKKGKLNNNFWMKLLENVLLDLKLIKCNFYFLYSSQKICDEIIKTDVSMTKFD